MFWSSLLHSSLKISNVHSKNQTISPFSGKSAANTKKVAFYAGLQDNIGPQKKDLDVSFNKVNLVA